jgi:hypothetical protein
MPTNHTHVSLHLFKERIVKRDIDIIQFLLVNIFICKDVIVRIFRYIIRLLAKIQQDHNDEINLSFLSGIVVRNFSDFTASRRKIKSV